jgi:hypothetical protein
MHLLPAEFLFHGNRCMAAFFTMAVERVSPAIDKHKKGASETTRPFNQAGSFITADFIDEPRRCRATSGGLRHSP